MSNKYTIVSPLPGVFYRKPGPDQPEFVTLGQTVKNGEVIGLIEIMKTFYEIKAEQNGIVESIAQDEETIDAGQDLAVLTVMNS